MKIMFGICTYNRKSILLRTAESLKIVESLDKVDIYIFDDCSTEYDKSFLHEIFPYAKKILISEVNKGADFNTNHMYDFFLNTDCDILFNADSDLLFNKKIVSKITNLLPQTDGFFSLFNTRNHEIITKIDDVFNIKNEVGAAGCCISRSVVKLITNEIKNCHQSFDWKFCSLLKENNIRILCTNASYVQHIGFIGQNANPLTSDYGDNFEIDSLLNAQLLEETLEEYFSINFENRLSNEKKIALNYMRNYSFGTKLIAKLIRILDKKS